MSDAPAHEPQFACIVQGLDCLTRGLSHALLGAPLECRERLIGNSHQRPVLLPANSVERRWILVVQLRDRAPEMRPRLAVANAATFGDPRDRIAACEGAKNLA